MGTAHKYKDQISNQKADKSSRGNYLPYFFFAAAAFFIFLTLTQKNNPTNTHKPSKDIHSAEYGARVNEHLKMTAQKMKQDQEAARVDNERSGLSELYHSKPQTAYDPSSQGVDFSSEDQWENMASKLRGQDGNALENLSPSESIQYDLFQQQKENEYSEAYKKAYAEAFVENARKQGYKIELTDDYKVKSVKKIIHPDRPALFE